MDEAATSMNWIPTLIGVVIGAIPLCLAAWLALRKGSAEIDKTKRNGVIDEWQAAVTRLTDELKSTTARLTNEINNVTASQKLCRATVDALETKSIKQDGVIAAMQEQIVARETERNEQRSKLDSMKDKVDEMKVPAAEEVADILITKIAASPLVVITPPKAIVTNLQPDEPC